MRHFSLCQSGKIQVPTEYLINMKDKTICTNIQTKENFKSTGNVTDIKK